MEGKAQLLPWLRWLLFLCLIPFTGSAQEESQELDPYIFEWEALEADTGLSLGDRLSAQTLLIKTVTREYGWSVAPVWDWTQTTLDLWETSPDIEVAREAYLSILLDLGQSLEAEQQPFSEEDSLRGYFQRALSLSLSPVEEGTLMLYLAESWFRSVNGDPEAIRRAESLLLQALDTLGSEIPVDAVHLHLGMLALQNSHSEDGGEAPNFTKAVFHFRAIQQLAGARQPFLEKAAEELVGLVKAELELPRPNRYLPQNDIRLTVRSRNVPYLEVDLVPLTSLGGIPVARTTELEQVWRDYEPAPEQVIVSRRYPVKTRAPFDWTETSLRLGGDFSGGWYGVRIKGGGLERKELLLVTKLEIVAIPRTSGNLAVWVTDVEKGMSLPNTMLHILNGEGKVLIARQTGENGFVLFKAEEIESWEELQVQSTSNPGILFRESLRMESVNIPWVIPGSQELGAGQSMSFAVFASAGGIGLDADYIPRIILPDSSVTEPLIQKRGSDWLSGELLVPESIGIEGPVYLELPDGHLVLLTHLNYSEAFPLQVKFSGDRLRADANLFVNTSTLGVQLDGPAQTWDELPDYIRLRISRIIRSRNVIKGAQDPPIKDEVLVENIFSREDAQNNGTLAAVPDLLEENQGLVVKVEAISLDEDEVLGRGYAALMNYRRIVHLETDERIIHNGESVNVEMRFEDLSMVPWHMNDGELAIYRETWESRYIHRKKGHLISESEYLILPDRSLLGAAKTDYRLAEQGYVREEVNRIPVKGAKSSLDVPIRFDLPGYYSIEFENGEAGLVPEYEDGSLEVWVLPETGDLHAFRAKQPRVIVEKNLDGTYESLLLLDRATSVLMDFEHEDGSTQTHIVRPDYPAVAFDYVPVTESPLTTCRFFIIGDRKTNYLWKTFRETSKVSWQIGTNRRLGVNSGDLFNWRLSYNGQPADSPLFWTFFPDQDAPLVNRRIRWQSFLHSEEFKPLNIPVMLLENALPLFHPLGEGLTGNPRSENKVYPGMVSSLDLLALYPELRVDNGEEPSHRSLSIIEMPELGTNLQLAGSFPELTGRWRLELFGQSTSGDIAVEEWQVSTDQPILSHLGGPPMLRLGDRADLRLELENTTRSEVFLSLGLQAEGEIRLLGSSPDQVSLSPESRKRIFFEVKGFSPGQGKLEVQSAGSGPPLQSLHSLEIVQPETVKAWKFLIVPPQKGIWNESLSFPDWQDGLFLTASGLGNLLPELWPIVRDLHSGQDPILAALGDWSLAQVVDFHGLPAREKPAAATENLLAILTDRQAADKGWSWIEGQSSDPWLTALVLWTLDTFKESSSQAFDTIIDSARVYLEDVLIDNTLEPGIRLFTLRALSAEAFHSNQARPTRIQARSFLEFLYQRSELSGGELSMLLEIARAYNFREEVTLLTGELGQLLTINGSSTHRGFFTESLLFLSLNETESVKDLPVERLGNTLTALGDRGPVRSWEEVAGMLNLMAAFYWKGEFNVDGQVRMTINKGEPVDLSLNPDISNTGLYSAEMDEGLLQQMDITVDTAFALSPVILAFVGSIPSGPELPLLPDSEVQYFREFDEVTLLTGAHRRQIELKGDLAKARVGEILRLRLTVVVEDSRPFAEFCFPVPAGLSMEGQTSEYEWESLSPALDKPEPEPASMQEISGQKSCLRIRLEPLLPGRHVIEIPFKVKWSGQFEWPDNTLLFPKSGQSFRIPNPGPLRISRRGE